jgi:prepilin signal peptidase PulO-like enzyme (type II secretory pathway)
MHRNDTRPGRATSIPFGAALIQCPPLRRHLRVLLVRPWHPGTAVVIATSWRLVVSATGRFTARLHRARLVVFLAILLRLVAADLEWCLLRNEATHPALVPVIAVSGLWPARSARDSLTGGPIGLAISVEVFVDLPGSGFGDVTLATLLRLVTDAFRVLTALLIGALAGGLDAQMLPIVRHARRRSTMAYGPWWALGALAGMLAPSRASTR